MMDYFHPWPKVAMVQVARKYLADIDEGVFERDEVGIVRNYHDCHE